MLLHSGTHSLTSALAAIGLGAMLGLALALGAILAASLSRRIPIHAGTALWRSPGVLVGTVVLVAGVALLNQDTFSGAWVRERSWAPLVQYLALLLVLLCAWGALHLLHTATQSRQRVCWLAAGAAAAAACAAWMDARILPGLYPSMHASLELACALSLMAMVWLLCPNPSVRLARALGAVALGAGLVAGTALHSDIVLRSHFIAAGPLQSKLVAMFAPADADDAWMKHRSSAASWISQRSRRATPDSQAAKVLDALLPQRRRMNLVIISVDTLRADRLAAYGAKASSAPFLDELAAQSSVCERAYTNYPLSSFAYSSMFTGLIPSLSPAGMLSRGQNANWGGSLALAELLTKNGFETAAFSAFNAECIAREDAFGHLTHGFSIFNPERRIVAWDGADLVDAACAALPRITQQRFMLWLHLLDPHAPYKVRDGAMAGTSPEANYDAEVRYCDEQIRRFVTLLRGMGRGNDTIIVVMGDHGEEFGEHGHRFHGTTLYEEQVRVPMFILVPGLAARRIAEPASVMDLMPTLLDLLALRDPESRHGTTLVPAMLGSDAGPRSAYAELQASQQLSSGGRRMIVEGDHKLIVDTNLNAIELYDLAKDPKEQTNIAAHLPERRAWLQALMNAIAAAAPETGEFMELEKLLADIESASSEQLTTAAWRLFSEVHDPVFALNRRFAAALLGPMKERVLAALERCALCGNPSASIPAMRLAAAIDATHLWQRMKHAPPLADLNWQVEYTLLRAAAGDPSVTETLRSSLSIDGMPEKQRIAELALRRRLPVPSALIHSILRSRCVQESAAMLRDSLQFAPKGGMGLIANLVDHPHWSNYAPVRRAAASLLAACSDDPEKTSLLARFARDDDPEVARAAAGPLARLVGTDLQRWLDCADLELRADDCMAHLDLNAALERLVQAVELCPENTRVQLRLARLEHLLEREEFARQRLTALAARGERLSTEARRRLDHPLDQSALQNAAIDLKLDAFSIESRSISGAWCAYNFNVSNSSEVTLPSGVLPTSLRFALKLVDTKGTVLDVPTSTEVLMGESDLLPNEERMLYGDFLAPAEPGDYGFALEPRILLPSGETRVLPLISVPGKTMTVHSWIPAEELIR